MFKFKFKLQKNKYEGLNPVNVEDLKDVLVVQDYYSKRTKKIKKGEIFFYPLQYICGLKKQEYDETSPIGHTISFDYMDRFGNFNISVILKYCGDGVFKEMNSGDEILYVGHSPCKFNPAQINADTAAKIREKLMDMKSNLSKYKLFLDDTAVNLREFSEYEKKLYLNVTKETREKDYSILKEEVTKSSEKTMKELDDYIENMESIMIESSYEVAQFENQLYNFADVDKKKYLV